MTAVEPTIIVATTTVVAAVIRDEGGRVLLTRRPDGAHMGGLWEFPGGKVEPGEGPATALRRELDEELGATVVVGRPITFAVHEEPELRILLLFYEVELSGGAPTAREDQEMAWVDPADLPRYPTPPADRELIEHLMGGCGVDRSRNRPHP
jgi:8-oxo-dGTP diphosphatase